MLAPRGGHGAKDRGASLSSPPRERKSPRGDAGDKAEEKASPCWAVISGVREMPAIWGERSCRQSGAALHPWVKAGSACTPRSGSCILEGCWSPSGGLRKGKEDAGGGLSGRGVFRTGKMAGKEGWEGARGFSVFV